jgi:hypothetical protein
MLDGVGVFKMKSGKSSEPYQVDVTVPLDQSFDDNTGGDDEETTDLLTPPDYEDELSLGVGKVVVNSDSELSLTVIIT